MLTFYLFVSMLIVIAFAYWIIVVPTAITRFDNSLINSGQADFVSQFSTNQKKFCLLCGALTIAALWPMFISYWILKRLLG